MIIDIGTTRKVNIKINMIYEIIILKLLLVWTAAFPHAPGTLKLKIRVTDSIDECILEECQYHLEFCIGSGKSSKEQCLWIASKNESGKYLENPGLVAQQSFEVDNVRSSYYFNANLTFYKSENAVKTIRFKDNIIKYNGSNGIYHESIQSTVNFISASIDMEVTCKPGFYPQFYCTKSCFKVPNLYDCDSNGTIVCVSGYVLNSSTATCVKDICKSSSNMCQNNSTCVNQNGSIRCECPLYYSGPVCEIWNPCKDSSCKNSGKCVVRELENDYICQCPENIYGKYCDDVEDRCKIINCPKESECQRRQNEAKCVPMTKTVARINAMGKLRTPSSTPMKNIISDIIDKNRETVKLIQYPVQKDFTTISVIIVLLVFLVCCLGVTFWMQRYKYFQKRKKYNSYPHSVPIPPIIDMPTYRSADENFKRWHSLDDSSFYIYNQPHYDQFSTMSYKSGSNLWPRYESPHDLYRDSDKNWPQTFKTRMPMMYESSDTAGDLCESTPNNLENLEDNANDQLSMPDATYL